MLNKEYILIHNHEEIPIDKIGDFTNANRVWRYSNLDLYKKYKYYNELVGSVTDRMIINYIIRNKVIKDRMDLIRYVFYQPFDKITMTLLYKSIGGEFITEENIESIMRNDTLNYCKFLYKNGLDPNIIAIMLPSILGTSCTEGFSFMNELITNLEDDVIMNRLSKGTIVYNINNLFIDESIHLRGKDFYTLMLKFYKMYNFIGDEFINDVVNGTIRTIIRNEIIDSI